MCLTKHNDLHSSSGQSIRVTGVVASILRLNAVETIAIQECFVRVYVENEWPRGRAACILISNIDGGDGGLRGVHTTTCTLL